MRLEHYSQQKLNRQILNIVGRFLPLTRLKVFYFGSRVTGAGSEYSDIDVGLIGEKSVPYFILGKIKEELENLSILYKIDLVDFKNTSHDFAKLALSKTEKIN